MTTELHGPDPELGADDKACWQCHLPFFECECDVGAECGRWRNGRLSNHCSKAGSEECDFECPYNR